MPIFDRGHTYVDGEDATEAIFNDPWDALEEFLNVTKLNGLNLQNGIITPAMLTTALQDALGVNGASTHRGKSIITTEESRVNTAYGLMSTADRVSSVVLPTNGLIRVNFQAMVKNSVLNAGSAALFVGANQLKANWDGAVGVQEAPTKAANAYESVFSFPGGLACVATGTYIGDAATGQVVGGGGTSTPVFTVGGTDVAQANGFLGGTCDIAAAAGTYDISVQFKATSGSVTAKNRKLWVEAVGF